MRYELNFDEDKIIDIEAIGDNGVLDLKDCCKLLNELNEENQRLKNDCGILVQSNQEYRKENEQLKQKIQRWKTLYEIKDKEVTARVDVLNKVCEYYLTEAQFKEDTDPNDAVKEVINENIKHGGGNVRECVNCKYSRGIGSDVWCGHNPKGEEAYMFETDCPYFRWWNDE